LTREHQSCRNMGPRGRAPGFISPPELPTLLNPLNSSPHLRSYPFDGCGDRNGGGTAALLTTTMSPADLIKHYDRRMSTSGWKQAPGPSKASSTWSRSQTDRDQT